MMDIREDSARFYDLGCKHPEHTNVPNDVPFYESLITSPDTRVLELGCGSGRVLVPLAEQCGYIHGLDCSPAMVAICKQHLAEAGTPPERASVEVADISDFHLGKTFDLITAPFRVLQNIEDDSAVDGLMRCIGEHLAPGGSCVLNTFNPNRSREKMVTEWCTTEERLSWEIPIPDGRVTCHFTQPRMDAERLILYPELIYRRYAGDELAEESVLKIAMRCYYAEDLLGLVTRHGFHVLETWGGYEEQAWGEGSELVVRFGLPR